MPRALTLSEFVDRARRMHGDEYDYSRVLYAGSSAMVEVICRRHGIFTVTPTNHTRGRGCPKCGRERISQAFRKDSTTFINQARAVHGDRYDYSRVDYLQARAKVIIVCRDHGEFLQTPDSHLRGNGCARCRDIETGNRFRADTQSFIARARAQYGDRYGYDRVRYSTAFTPVTISCAVHGDFEQTPVAHLAGTHGCPRCARAIVNVSRRLTTDEFLRRAREVHGDQYRYQVEAIKDSRARVTVICPTHGPFRQVAMTHLSGRGCRACGSERSAIAQRASLEHFIERARAVHGAKYDYSLVQYQSARRKISIVCPIHGAFAQTPDSHLAGGCRRCADEELSGTYSLRVLQRNPVLAAKPAILYYLCFRAEDGESFFKVGITTTSVAKRFAGYAAAGYRYEVLKQTSLPLMVAYEREQRILSLHCKQFAHRPSRGNRRGFLFGGGSECFSQPLPEALVKLFALVTK